MLDSKTGSQYGGTQVLMNEDIDRPRRNGVGRTKSLADTTVNLMELDRRRQIESAAAKLFFLHGYQATTLRDIAHEVGIKPASLYYHFPSKQDLLFAVLNRTIDDLIDLGEQALSTESNPPDQLRRIVGDFILYVANRPREGMVGDIEIEHLEESNRATLLSKRDRYQRIIEQIVTKGVDQGVFSVSDVKMTVFAMLGMCNHIAIWFRPGKRRSAAEVAEEFGQIALRMVAFQPLADLPNAIGSITAPAN